MIRTVIFICAALVLAGCSDQGTRVVDPGDGGTLSFASDVRPVLEAHCVACHVAGGGGNAGLDLTSYAGLMSGSQNGPVVVAGQPDSSVLMHRIESTDPGFLMPSGGPRLAEAQIAAMRNWILAGALDD